MAEDKLSWSELRHALAQRANVSEKVANTFLNAMNAQLVEALKQDKQVKINGLGTFRLQAVAPRKSVNVTTGEAIIIEGYNKIAFAPEASIKEMIEGRNVKAQPLSALTQTNAETEAPVSDGIDPLKKLNEQANEIIDILADLGQAPNEEKKKEEPKKEEIKPAEPVVPETPKYEAPTYEAPKYEAPAYETPKYEAPAYETPKVEEPKVEITSTPVAPSTPSTPSYQVPTPPPAPTYQAPAPTPTPSYQAPTYQAPTYQAPTYQAPTYQAPKVEPAKKAEEPKTEEPKQESHFWRNLFIWLLILLLLGGAGYYCYTHYDLRNWIETKFPKKQPVKAETMWPEVERDIANDTIELSPETPEKEPEVVQEPFDVRKYKYIKVEPMHRNSRLAWMSMRYYGSKAYWPYIYDANRDRITNPNDVEVGTPIRVPKLSRQQRDTTIESSRLRLQELRRQAEAASKR